EGCLLDMGVESQLLEKSGSWFLYQGERLGQGRENAKAYLKANADAANRLEKALRDKFCVIGADEAARPEPAAAPAVKPAGKLVAAKGKGAE
ncbi:MAG: DNA recombination/repair protein RecA, partial [Elusimicrobia bacterium]|nr:DNA recombination/repair protein RecA [Elusimicrobiota bacterium]